MKKTVKRIALSFGYDIKRITSHSSGHDFVEDIGRLFARNESMTCFDIGANIGQTASRFRMEFPTARIFSFEPCKNTYLNLKAKFHKDNLIHCFNFALGREKSQAKLYKYQSSELNSFRQQPDSLQASQTEVVNIETLDKVCVENGVTTIEVLKSDTEGFDLEVLMGGEGLFRAESIKAVVVEATFDFNDLVHSNFFKMSKFLAGYGFSVMSIYDVSFMPSSGRINHFNVLFTHKSLESTLIKLEG